ncbi:MAG: SPOR domain-containing protein [Rhodobacteraceae bacterium]|nr:SPOR domain-containing protein [Paracoccaceae bacterium]MBR9820522.1 SPOR domain-containing protein [Paracoccaceae bacterium]
MQGILSRPKGLTLMRGAVALCAVLAVSACEDGGQMQLFKSSQESPEASRGQTRSTKLIERDVEAPEVFQVTESGLWDGRPSLGGVWVAHPDVTEPERVLIRNTDNDNFVIGALFRRETVGPGPRLQVSSDAAAALGMLAGAPEQLNVTALRRETIDPAPATPAPLPASATMPAAAAVETETLDPVGADTTAMLDATADPAPQDMAAATAPRPGSTTQEPEKKGLFGWLRRKDTTAPAPEMAAASAPEVTAAPLDGAPPVTQPVAAPAPSSLDKPFIQLGIFSVRQNAENTAVAMRQRALSPEVVTHESQGKTFYRVIVGPARSEAERATMLQITKDAGFTDAYAVTN